MKRNIPLLLILFLGLFAVRCAEPPTSPLDEIGEPEEPGGQPPVIVSASRTALVYFQNRFGLSLFTEVNAQEAGDRNLLISPLSVSMALGMTMNGAAGATRTAMEQTLGFDELSEDAINQTYRDLMDQLTGLDPNVIFQIANSIWIRDTFRVASDFIDVNRTYFDAEVEELNFDFPEAAQIINDWVNEKTNGKITEIVQAPIDPLIIMYLINAIYFKGNWSRPFDPDETTDAEFYLSDGSSKLVPTMRMETVYFPYFKDRDYDFQAVDLAYGDSLFTMTILLPHRTWHIDDFIAQLNQAVWDTCISNLHRQKLGLLEVPRFKFEYDIKLNDVLKAMGMDIAFDPHQADFSRMSADSILGIFLGEVKHKTFVEVNEEGTEAAAATSVGPQLLSAGAFFRVDRPFVFAIRERTTGTIIFIGKVVDPTA